MERKDELLQMAEQLAGELRLESRNEMKRILSFYKKHQDYDQLIRLLDSPLPQYGKREAERWKKLGDVLKRKKSTLLQYTPDEIAFIFGWVARLPHSLTWPTLNGRSYHGGTLRREEIYR